MFDSCQDLSSVVRIRDETLLDLMIKTTPTASMFNDVVVV